MYVRVLIVVCPYKTFTDDPFAYLDYYIGAESIKSVCKSGNLFDYSASCKTLNYWSYTYHSMYVRVCVCPFVSH